MKVKTLSRKGRVWSFKWKFTEYPGLKGEIDLKSAMVVF